MSKVYSVFDDKAEVFNVPFFATNDNVAIRSFADACNDSRQLMSRYPHDFHLYCLGEFDEDKGVIVNGDKPVFLVNAVSLVNLPVGSEESVDIAMSGSARGKDMRDA